MSDNDVVGTNIVVDTREPWEKICEYLYDQGAEDYVVEKLPHKADFRIENETVMGIQRKEIGDFVSSVDDTLKDDLRQLRANYPHSALLIEGRWKANGRNILLRRGNDWFETASSRTVHRFILSQQIKGTMFFNTMSLRETCSMLVDIHRYLDDDVPENSTLDQPVSVLTMFPNIGPKAAGRLVDHYGNIGNALEDCRNWNSVKGIGNKTQDDIDEWLK